MAPRSGPFNSHNSGGRFALAGFLYQILGTASLVACPSRVQTEENGDASALLELVSGEIVFPEMLGQDAVVDISASPNAVSPIARVLIQYKYSTSPDTYPIRESDLTEIIGGLRDSLPDLKQATIASTRFVLVTNRQLAAKLKKAKPVKSQSADAKIRNKIEVIRAPGAYWLANLRQFAARFGLLDSEFEPAVNKLVGELMFMNVGGNASIDTKWLTAGLTGRTDARDIRPHAIANIMKRDLSEIPGNHSFPHQIVRRRLVSEIIAAAQSSPIVILEGNGGCGKTVAMYASLNAGFSSSNALAYYFMKCATELSDHPIQDQVCRWRFPTGTPHNDDLMSSVARLQNASDNRDSPALYFGIDGIDEAINRSQDNTYRIGNLLRDAWAEYRRQQDPGTPQWSIIVSCRRESEVARCWDSFRNNEIKMALKRIQVKDFDSDEMKLATDAISNSDVRARLLNALEGRSKPTSLNTRSAINMVDASILEVLRHPVLWECFAMLESDEQKLVLDSSFSGLQLMINSYLKVFIRKFHRRYAHLQSLDVRSLINRVTRAAPSAGRSYERVNHWIRPAIEGGEWTEREAAIAWDEAISFGMTLEDETNAWMWKYPFMAETLAAATSKKED